MNNSKEKFIIINPYSRLPEVEEVKTGREKRRERRKIKRKK